MMFNYFQISNLTSECEDSIDFEGFKKDSLYVNYML